MLRRFIPAFGSIQGRLTQLVILIVVTTVVATTGANIAVRTQRAVAQVRENIVADGDAVATIAADSLRRGLVPQWQLQLSTLLRQRRYHAFNVTDVDTGITYLGMEDARPVAVPLDPLVQKVISTGLPILTEAGGRIRLIRPAVDSLGTVAVLDIDADSGMPPGRLAEMLTISAICALVLIAVFVPLGLLIARRIVMPLKSLTAAAARLKDGDLSLGPMPQAAGEVGVLVATLQSLVGHLHRDTSEIRRLAQTDTVTGLGNRDRFQTMLEAAIRHHQQTGVPRALLFVDIDHFKQINDVFGHLQGDAILAVIAQKFRDACTEMGFPSGDPAGAWKELPPDMRLSSLARYAGDEFTVLLRNHRGAGELAAVAERLCAAARLCIDLDGATVQLGASIGIIDFEGTTVDPAELLRFADLAMYEAKRSGRDRYAFFTAELDQRFRDKLLLEMELRKAISLGEFEVVYMPQITLKGGRCASVEALVRWRHPRRGLLNPGTFIQLAEETGLIVEIDRIVMEEACRQAAEWADKGWRICVAVNISPTDFHRPDFIDAVLNALERHGLDPTQLELELTESVAMANPSRVAAIVTQLRAIGVRLAIDDFGTGYSNLGHLTTLSFDILKVDQSFVRALGQGPNAEAEVIVDTILNLAHNLGVATVAEGVETVEQAAYLRKKGCVIGQGYYFGRPMEPEALEARFAAQAEAETQQRLTIAHVG